MLAPGSLVAGRYRIVRRIAAGGMGAVYEATHVETERLCALKVMLPGLVEQRDLYERFKQEARAAATVDSEHVAQVFDAGLDEATGTPFLVMELLRGHDLSRRLSLTGPLPAAEVATVVRQAARGIDALHRAGIIHRDLKPSNLFLAERADGPPRIKILDLGIAKKQTGPATASTATLGTPHYMAPEQLHGTRIGSAIDIYALGLIAFTLLVAKEYWSEEEATSPNILAFMLAIYDGPREPATARAQRLGVTLPDAFDAWFARATADDPDKRFPTALDAADALFVALDVEASEVPLRSARSSEEAVRRDTQIQGDVSPDISGLANAPTERAPEDIARTGTLTLDSENPKPPSRRSEGHTNSEKPGPSRQWWVAGALGLVAITAVAAAFLRREPVAAPPVPPPLPTVSALTCAPATLSGHAPTKELAAALGLGACARLAVELGVPWPAEKDATPLDVTADLRPDGSARVTLEAQGRAASAEGESPLVATNAAVVALAKELSPRALTPDEIAVWGARDEASARRIARVLHRRVFGFTDDPKSEILALARSDGESPIPHAMVAFATPRESEASSRARDEAMRLLDRLPPARAHLIEAALLMFRGRPGDPAGRGDSLWRTVYAENADDPDFAPLFTMGGCVFLDEMAPMFDRIPERFPAARVALSSCAFGVDTDPARLLRTLDGLRAVLPEYVAYETQALVEMKRVDDARAALDLADRLGPPQFTREGLARPHAIVALADLDPKGALAAADTLFGDPDVDTSTMGATYRIRALLLGGKMIEAESASFGEYTRELALKDVPRALDPFERELRFRRLIDHPLPTMDTRLAQVEGMLPARREQGHHPDISLEIELLLAHRGRSKAELSAALSKLEAERSQFKDLRRTWAVAFTLPLVRLARGEEAVAKIWSEMRAPDARVHAALEAALALEALGRPGEAEQAYRVAMERPWHYPFDAIAARLRLARLLRARGEEGEARRLEAEVDRAWTNADPNLRDIVLRMK